MPRMRMLGIDPGLSITGFACLRAPSPTALSSEIEVLEAGCFRFSRRLSVSARLAELETDLVALVERIEPTCMSVESLFAHVRHPQTAITMAHARGVILLVAQRASLPIVELPPAEVKKALTGNGRATKAQVQRAVASQLRLEQVPEPPDVADAIAVALCGLTRSAGILTNGASR